MRRARLRTAEREARRRSRLRASLSLGAGAAVSAASIFVPAVPAGADTTFTVTQLGDAGDGTCDASCTLRDALEDANAAAGADVVTFASDVTGTITLGGTEIPITDAVTIQGPGAATLTVSGDNLSRIFNIDGVDDAEIAVTIDGLTLTKGTGSSGGAVISDETILTISNSVLTGNTATSGAGGALYDSDGNLLLLNSVVSNNKALSHYGGGVHVEDNDAGDILIRDSVITGNQAEDGGGIMFYDLNRGYENGVEHGATILRTTISGNIATAYGGGVYLEDAYGNGGAVTILDSTISGNSAEYGGGIYKGGGDDNDTDKVLTITNTTISGNTAAVTGGGIYIDDDDDSVTTISHSTITGNTATAGGGIYRVGDDYVASTEKLVLANSIVADNTADDLADPGSPEGSFELRYSLVENPGTAVTTEAPAGSNLIGVDPQLGPLQDNGGPTQTQKPLAGSPVIGAGDPDFSPPPAFDQRGFAREVNRLDMGAVEVEAFISIGDVALTEGDGGTANAVFPVTLSAPSSTPITVNFTTADGSATSPADFAATSGTVTFAAGETSKTIVVPVVGDDEMEGTETFVVNLSGASGAPISDAQGVATITDDDVNGIGYRMVAADGGIFTFGDRLFHGSTGDMKLNKPIVGGATDVSDNEGYWIVASDGGVFAFDAPFFGSLGDKAISSPAVEIEPTPTGLGYWIVLADGKVFTFGDAEHFGDMSGKPLNKPIIGMSVTPSGKGYWLVAGDGGIFNFGDAQFFGSMGDKKLNAPIIDLAPSVDNAGYYLLGSDGGVFTFGSADFKGSTGDMKLNAPVVAMLIAPNGAGYWLAASDGGVFTFGTPPFLGSMGGTKLNSPVLDLIL